MMSDTAGAPPPLESMHPAVRVPTEGHTQHAPDPVHLPPEPLGGEVSAVAQMAPYVTDPTQFLLNVPVEKPFTTQVPASLFDECVTVLKRTVQWRVSSTRYNGALPQGRRYAWRKHFVCDHSGKPRDRRNPDLAPGKRRSRRASIKIGCPASFTATQEVGSDTVTMVCRFQHHGHTVNTREYWASSRIPDNVREWIKDRVAEVKDFIHACETVASGGVVIDPDVASALMAASSRWLTTLTPREMEVLEHMAEGLSNAQIAEKLYLSGAAVAKHVSSIFSKLGLAPDEDNRRVRAILMYLAERGVG